MNDKITKVDVIAPQGKLENLIDALDNIGITGMTVSNVLGYGMQKGHTEYYRGTAVNVKLLQKVKVEIVICNIPLDIVIDTIKKVLYTGKIGDGKIFIYDVTNVIRISNGLEGKDAL